MKTPAVMGSVFAVLLAHAPSIGAGAIVVGMERAALIAERGEPPSQMSARGRAIYRWPDVAVYLENDKVTLVDWRDPAAEQAEAERRERMLAEQAAQAEAEATRMREAAAKAAEEAERLRPERERAELRARLEELERAQAAAVEREREREQAEARERQSRLALLRREYWQALDALKKANAAGDETQAKIWRRVLHNKTQEIQLLGGKL